MNKIRYLLAIVMMLSASVVWAKSKQAPTPANIVVHRDPSCSCCEKWVAHLKQNHFKVEDIVTNNVQAIKDKNGVTQELASCHTALVNGYVIEGHVPAEDINKLLTTKPDVVGIAVPKMPSDTPGMEMGGRVDPYQVISFDKNKQKQIFSDHPVK